MTWENLLEILTQLKADTPDVLAERVEFVTDGSIELDLSQSLTTGRLFFVASMAEFESEGEG